jgi:hypothetical protein
LSGGIPEFDFHVLPLDFPDLALVVGPDGTGGVHFEGSLDDAKQDAGLSDGGISDEAGFDLFTHRLYKSSVFDLNFIHAPQQAQILLIERPREGGGEN